MGFNSEFKGLIFVCSNWNRTSVIWVLSLRKMTEQTSDLYWWQKNDVQVCHDTDRDGTWYRRVITERNDRTKSVETSTGNFRHQKEVQPQCHHHHHHHKVFLTTDPQRPPKWVLRGGNIVISLSISRNVSFTQGRPVAAYFFFPLFPSHLIFPSVTCCRRQFQRSKNCNVNTLI